MLWSVLQSFLRSQGFDALPLQTRRALDATALSFGLPLVRPGVSLLAILATAAVLTSCDLDPWDPKLQRGWVTNCVGPEFGKFAQNGHAGPGPERPVFKINDQLVLAVPKENSPRSVSIDHEPRTCTKVSDLPTVPYVYFYFQGNWSTGYHTNQHPLGPGMGTSTGQPDTVIVRIEQKEKLSDEQRQEIEESRRKALQEQTKDMYQVSGLTCLRGGCSAARTGDSDIVSLKYQELSGSLVAIYAGYNSRRYGGSQLWWQTVTSDLAHWRDIDDEVWRLIDDWNLLNKGTELAAPLASNNRWRGP
jgi:hypothetical protein